MKVTETEIEEILRLLAETPRRIAATTGLMNTEQLHHRPDAKIWSANDILAHLLACADVWGETIVAMLQEDDPTLKHVSPREWLKKTDHPARSFHELFQSFVDQRRQLLQTLHDLEFNQWSQGAMIKGRRHTIFSQARRMALHEVTHCEQLEALVDTL